MSVILRKKQSPTYCINVAIKFVITKTPSQALAWEGILKSFIYFSVSYTAIAVIFTISST